MTASEHATTTDDEGGEAPCFAHLLDHEMSEMLHGQFVIELTEAPDER